jgi:metal-dependent amidase/aminoacylase/carboxypeptidase family protein
MMTLWNIEQGLADLFERREELLSNPPPFGASADDPDETYDRQLMAVDVAIASYIKAEVQKVDGVRGWWKHLEMIRDAAKAEAKTMQDRAAAADRQLTVLKNAIQITLEEMEWRAGKPRKLEGKTGSISLVGNGGRQPVVITDEALIPDEYRTVTVKMNAELWRKICAALPDLAGMQECRKEPNLTLIYNALESGMDGVPGAVLAPLGSHVRVK